MAYTSSFCGNIHNYYVAAVMLFFTISILFLQSSNAAAVSYNVMKFGARADGKTDSTQAFVKAWASACSSGQGNAVMYIPKGRFLLKAVVFRGPCKTRQVTVRIDGTLVSPMDYRALGNSGYWILFIEVTGLRVLGGSLDARGVAFWACRKSGKSCPVGARVVYNVQLGKQRSGKWFNIDQQSGNPPCSQQLQQCGRSKVKLIAPSESPNTDGIHVQSSTGVTITGSILQTGDDCISIGPGTRNLYMSNIKCGPGHGVSIGSLGKDLKEDGVQNVTLTNAVFSGSDNGVRIKSWARPSTGFVKNILFQNIIMRNVKNPVIIDQDYCPNNQGCPSMSSGVKISQVTYRNIQGTSGTAEAVTFECSPSTPCTGIRLQDIKLTYLNKATTSSCKNIGGTSTGLLMPDSCI